MSHDTPHDPERAHKRCLEIMGEIEADARKTLGGRVFSKHTAWRYPRKLIEASMYVQLYDNNLRGFDLDQLICDLLDPHCNLRTNAAESRPVFRAPQALSRREHGEVNLPGAYTADSLMPSRNEAADIAGHEETDIVLHQSN